MIHARRAAPPIWSKCRARLLAVIVLGALLLFYPSFGTPALSLDSLGASQHHSSASISAPPSPPRPASRSCTAPPVSPPPDRPLVLSWLNGWAGSETLLMEPVASVLRMATGLDVVLRGPCTRDADVDVFLVAQFGSKEHVQRAKALHGGHALFLWFAGEQVEDSFVDVADVSFGQAVEPVHQLCEEALEAPHFLRMPYWMTTVVAARGDPLRCELDPRLYASTDPDAWAARPGFAVHVSSHGGWPRDSMVAAFAELAAALDNETGSSSSSSRRTVDCPGRAYHNAEWPADIPNDGDRGVGKALLAARYRFSVQPENSESTCGGYVTEKLMHGLLGGAVPVHWGDPLEPDAAVFNLNRILFYKSGTPMEWTLEAARRLELNDSARRAFFAAPVLSPGAGAWVASWCERAAALVRRAALANPALRLRVMNRTAQAGASG